MEKTFSDGPSRITNCLQESWETEKMKDKISLTSVHCSVVAGFCTLMKLRLWTQVRSWAPPVLAIGLGPLG